MNIVEATQINSFAHVAQQAEVSPEEPIFVLTGSQLQEIISGAIQEATERLYLEIAYDRQRISKLEQREPQPLQKDRGEILRALIAANDGKMLAKEARLKMRLSKAAFSVLLATMKEKVGTKPYHLNKSAKVLVLR